MCVVFFQPFKRCANCFAMDKSFHTEKSGFPRPRILMKRFLPSRSSSQEELQPLDDVRAERATIALSVGLSWPPDRYTKTRGRPSWRQLWERALQEHILDDHELPHGVRPQRPVWWRSGEAIDRLLTHEELAHTKTPRAATAAPATPLKTSPAAVVRSAARSTSTPSLATGSSTCWTSGGENGDGTCSGVCARSSVCAPGCSTGSTRTLPIAGSGARHEQRRAAGEAC